MHSPAVLLETWLCEEQEQELSWTFFRDHDLLVHEVQQEGHLLRAQAWRPAQRQHPLFRPQARLLGQASALHQAELPTRIAETTFRIERMEGASEALTASTLAWRWRMLVRAEDDSPVLWFRLDPAVELEQLSAGGQALPLEDAGRRRTEYPWQHLRLPTPLEGGDSLWIECSGRAPLRLAQDRLGADYWRPRRAWHPVPDPRQALVSRYSPRTAGGLPAVPERRHVSPRLLPVLPVHAGSVMPIDSSLALLAGRDIDPAVFQAEDLGSTTRAFTRENLLDRERDWRPLNPAHPDEREAQQRFLRDEGLSARSDLSEEVAASLEHEERRRLPQGLGALSVALEELLGAPPVPLRLRIEQEPRTAAARIRMDHLGPGGLPVAQSITHEEKGGGDAGLLAQSRALARAWWLEGPAWSADTPAWVPEGLALHSALLALESAFGVPWAIERRREGLERALHVERFYTGGRSMSPALGSRCGGLWRDPVLLEHNAWRFALALENLRNGRRLGGEGSDAQLAALYRSLCRGGSPRVLGWGPLLQQVQAVLGRDSGRQLAQWMFADRLPRLGLVAQRQEQDGKLVLRTRLLAGALPIELPVLLDLPGGEELALLHVRQREQVFPLEVDAAGLKALKAAPWHSLAIEELR